MIDHGAGSTSLAADCSPLLLVQPSASHAALARSARKGDALHERFWGARPVNDCWSRHHRELSAAAPLRPGLVGPDGGAEAGELRQGVVKRAAGLAAPAQAALHGSEHARTAVGRGRERRGRR